jgi:cardiolipin synthase
MTICLISWLEDFSGGVWVLGSVLHVGAVLMVTGHALRRRRSPSATVLWIAVAWSFPAFGALLYLAFGVDRVPDKGLLKHTVNQSLLHERALAGPLAYGQMLQEQAVEVSDPGILQDFNRALDTVIPDHPLLGGNRVDVLVTGDEAFPQVFDAIENAKHHIHIMSFIINNDSHGRRLMKLLVRKAKDGVQVRLMYDRFGSTHGVLSGLFRRARKVPGFKVVGWTQANPLKRQFQINLRNHRKIMVVDGTVAFTGGMNLTSLNIDRPGRPAVRDYHFKVTGPVVHELQYAFIRDWYFMTREPPRELLTPHFFPELEPVGEEQVRMLNSGPCSEMELIADAFFTAVTSAKKQVLVVTPYFAPNQDLVRALRTAGMRGLDVRLLVPKKNNHFYAGWAGRALYSELLEAGVRVFERRPPFLHGKAMVVDGELVLVGSANMDVRSLRLNYETNLAVCGAAFADRMKAVVLDELRAADEILLEDWVQRPWRHRLAENFCSLMTPVL